jgi:hypothetical protein
MTTLTLLPKVSVTSRAEDLLWQCGLIIIAFLPVTFLVSLDDPRQLNAINIWAKPMKFYVSVGLHMMTLAFVARFINADVRGKFSVYGLSWVLTFTVIAELAYLTIQAARGRHSHWNFETQFESLMYAAMGVGAVIMILVAAVIGLLVYRYPVRKMGQGLRLGILLGMVLGFITTLIVAGYMSSQNSHWVGGVPSDADGLPIVGWARGGGDLRVPHFFATHLMQIIPLIGWMADRYSQRPTRIVIAASAIGVSAVAATFIQALSGQPFI